MSKWNRIWGLLLLVTLCLSLKIFPAAAAPQLPHFSPDRVLAQGGVSVAPSFQQSSKTTAMPLSVTESLMSKTLSKEDQKALIQEAEKMAESYYFTGCMSHEKFASFHDCRCVAGMYKDAYIKAGGAQSEGQIATQMGRECVNPAGVKERYFSQCMSTAKDYKKLGLTQLSSEEFCSCAAAKMAQKYAANPSLFSRHISNLYVSSHKECRKATRDDLSLVEKQFSKLQAEMKIKNEISAIKTTTILPLTSYEAKLLLVHYRPNALKGDMLKALTELQITGDQQLYLGGKVGVVFREDQVEGRKASYAARELMPYYKKYMERSATSLRKRFLVSQKLQIYKSSYNFENEKLSFSCCGSSRGRSKKNGFDLLSPVWISSFKVEIGRGADLPDNAKNKAVYRIESKNMYVSPSYLPPANYAFSTRGPDVSLIAFDRELWIDEGIPLSREIAEQISLSPERRKADVLPRPSIDPWNKKTFHANIYFTVESAEEIVSRKYPQGILFAKLDKVDFVSKYGDLVATYGPGGFPLAATAHAVVVKAATEAKLKAEQEAATEVRKKAEAEAAIWRTPMIEARK